MKKSISSILCLIMIMCFIPCIAQNYDPETDFEVSPTDGGRAWEITRYVGAKQSVNIPPTIQGKSVVSIGESAFVKYGRDRNGDRVPVEGDLRSVTIPNSVRTIGEGAFYANQLTSITIPNSVTTIGDYAFSDNNLTSLTLGSGVTTIGEEAFSDNQLSSLTIPNNVRTITEDAFNGNPLKTISIGANTTFRKNAMDEEMDAIAREMGMQRMLVSSTDDFSLFVTAYNRDNRRAGTYRLREEPLQTDADGTPKFIMNARGEITTQGGNSWVRQ